MHHDAPPFLKGRGEGRECKYEKKCFTADIILKTFPELGTLRIYNCHIS